MALEKLNNAPLVEAIFEARWEPDDHQGVLVGRFYETLKNQFPIHEALPAASLPPEIAQHAVQHRFRAAKGKWPVVQIGPGIATANQTEEYDWDSFRDLSCSVVTTLNDKHPGNSGPSLKQYALRYLNAYPFDFGSDDAFGFLRDKMNIRVDYPERLFDAGEPRDAPTAIQVHSTFHLSDPEGRGTVKINSGTHLGEPAIVWELAVVSDFRSADAVIHEDWLDAAHRVCETWFVALVEGELLEGFK